MFVYFCFSEEKKDCDESGSGFGLFLFCLFLIVGFCCLIEFAHVVIDLPIFSLEASHFSDRSRSGVVLGSGFLW